MRVRSLVATASIATGVIVATMSAESLSSTSAQNLYMQTNEIRNAIIHYSRSADAAGRRADGERRDGKERHRQIAGQRALEWHAFRAALVRPRPRPADVGRRRGQAHGAPGAIFGEYT